MPKGKPRHGWRADGGGRKKSPPEKTTIAVSVRMLVSERDRLRAQADADGQGLSLSAYIAHLLHRIKDLDS